MIGDRPTGDWEDDSVKTCWVSGTDGAGFGIDTLPYCVFAPAGGEPRVGAGIGEYVVDLAAALGSAVFARPALNEFLVGGRQAWRATRAELTELLTDERHRPTVEPALHRIADVRLDLPFEVADYVDFYASEHHASNVGAIFRPDAPALKPNWKHLPVGYHGRAGTVVPSGTPIVRPHGQWLDPGDGVPRFGPSQRLDIEAEVGFVVGAGSVPGRRVPVRDFPEHVFGVCLVNDWSARDIQSWEYVPLGPFLGKSFATSISPWIVPLEALHTARVPTPAQDPAPLEYLREPEPWGLDLRLEVEINDTVVSRPPYAGMYWSPAQMLAHLTVNGARLRTGDLYASGTVSGPERDQRGCLLELTWGGQSPLRLASGDSRTYLADGDTVTIRGWAPGAAGSRITLGEVTGTVLGGPADDPEA